MPARPLVASWVCGENARVAAAAKRDDGVNGEGVRSESGDGMRCDIVKDDEKGEGVRGDGGGVRNTDYERIVLMKLRQAEERKGIAEQLKQERDS